MNDHRSILKRVGMILVAFGLADIAFMVYSVAQGHSYSSSFNVFSVVAGILLIRGSLGTARFLTWVSAFMLTCFIGAFVLAIPLSQPFGLLVAQVRFEPARFFASWLMLAVVLAILGWTYRQLRTAPVLAALQESGRSTATPKLAIGLGLALVVFLVVVLNMTLDGAMGDKAIELARGKLGPDYNYVVQSISTQSVSPSGSRGQAIVAAYNDSGIQYVPVEWSE